MAKEVAWAPANPAWRMFFSGLDVDSAAFHGQLSKARELTNRAIGLAERAEEKETAAGYAIQPGRSTKLVSETPREAKQRSAATLALARNRDVDAAAG